jgi:cytochrome P450
MATAPLDFATLDYYTEPRLINDPNPYFENLRTQGPVARLPQHNVVAVTGYEEAVQVYTDLDTFSSVNAVTGPSRRSLSRSTAATSPARSRRGGPSCR